MESDSRSKEEEEEEESSWVLLVLLLFDDEFILWFQISQNLKVSSEEAEAIDFPSGDLKKKNEELNWLRKEVLTLLDEELWKCGLSVPLFYECQVVKMWIESYFKKHEMNNNWC